MVENKVILESKSVEEVSKASAEIAISDKKQLLTYLRLADKRFGLLINFGAAFIKDGIFRIMKRLEESYYFLSGLAALRDIYKYSSIVYYASA